MTQLLSSITKEMPAATHPGALVIHSRAWWVDGAPLFWHLSIASSCSLLKQNQ